MREKQTFLLSDKAREALDAANALYNNPDMSAPELEVAPGEAALKICPDILNEISRDVRSVIVTGTNGKTTVVRMIASILEEAGIDFISNSEGANMENRITGLYCGNFDPSDGPGKKTAVIECDEGYLRLVMPRINPLCLVITSIYPDQLERFGSEEHVAELICEGMRRTTPATCIVAEDCHFLEDKISRVYGWSFDEYDVLDDGQGYEINIPGAFNQKNAAAAARVGHLLGISEDVIRKGLAKTKPAFGRFEAFDHGKGQITICLAKNAAGFEAISDWITGFSPEKKRQIIIAMNANAGDDKDTAWLKDNDYSRLMDAAVSNLVTGTCADVVMDAMKDSATVTRADVVMGAMTACAASAMTACADGAMTAGATGDSATVTMKTCRINATECGMQSIPDACADFDGETIIVANYTAMMQIREIFVRMGKLREYWEV